MGLFDGFFKEEQVTKKTRPTGGEISYEQAYKETEGASIDPNSDNLPTPLKPKSFEDVYALLDQLKLGRAVAVNCSELKETTAIRVLDILCGAAYALQGSWKPYGPEIFIFRAGTAYGGGAL